MASPIVVFDLDGTLVDTAEDIIGSINSIFVKRGIPEFTLGSRKGLVSAGGRVLIKAGLTDAGLMYSDHEIEIMFQEFICNYTENVAIRSRLYPGVENVLQQLRDNGYTLAICTNKSFQPACKLLKRLGIFDFFNAVCGNDSFPWPKPDPRALLSTIKQADGDQSRSVMIGDTKIDIETAKRAGIPVIAVDFGYSDEPLEGLKPDYIISHFDSLLTYLELILFQYRPDQARFIMLHGS